MFSVAQIIQATGGSLVQGSLKDKFKTISTDSRHLKAHQAFLALRGKNFDGHNFLAQALKAQASCLIISDRQKLILPKNVACIQVKDTTLALGDIAAWVKRKFDLPLVAITGSNGKTTTKEMISWILAQEARVLKNEGTKNNQIGLPQTLLKLSRQDDFAVVEIGTNHFGEVKYLAKIAAPNIGVITNIAPSHLEFLKDLSGVLKEKSQLLNNLVSPALALLNADDLLLQPLIKRKMKGVRVLSYGINTPSDFRASKVRFKNNKVEFQVNGKFNFVLSTLGRHNVYNALAAIGVSRIFGLDYKQIARRLADFNFPSGRLKLIKFQGLRFIDDTYNSNPFSLKAALEALKAAPCAGRKILIMGDMLELGEKKELLHRQIAGSITNTCDLLLTVGSLAKISSPKVAGGKLELKNIFACNNILEAKNLLFGKLAPSALDLILVKGSRYLKMEEVFKI